MAELTILAEGAKEATSRPRLPESCAMVIFGASGDLTSRKLMPALFHLFMDHLLPKCFAVIGCANTSYGDEQFRDRACQAVREAMAGKVNESQLGEFAQLLFYVTDDFSDSAAYTQLDQALDKVDRDCATRGNRLYYLATPPDAFPTIVQHLGSAGLARPGDPEKNWARIVIEKPFGRDRKSARELNKVVKGVFQEEEIYRIDHYLGRETVQNLFVLRFANGIFEPVWNRRYIDHVQITMAETLGVENRGAYYEQAGVVRDVVQNHVLQMLSLIAMEPPARFQANAVRDEKSKLLRAVRPIPLDRLEEFAVRGQYLEGLVEGEKVPAYRSEPKVDPHSTTETYAALKLFIDNWRWASVPFYLRSGKRLAKRVTEVTVHFRQVPHIVFGDNLSSGILPNILSICVQPDEGIDLRFSAKLPGTAMEIRPVKMEFRYNDAFGGESPPAYETLILDCMLGDSTLFTRADTVESAWELLDPLLERWKQDGAKGLASYRAGTWGPPEADAFMKRDGREWLEL
jgi:glucose-6-phosphate 1-dehydrogenase